MNARILLFALTAIISSSSTLAIADNSGIGNNGTGGCSNGQNAPLVASLKKFDQDQPADLAPLIKQIQASKGAVTAPQIRQSLINYSVKPADADAFLRTVESAQNRD